MKVKVEYLFSKRNQIGSKFISWGTKELLALLPDVVPSHVSVLLNGRWVFESTFSTGVRVISYKKWKEINEEVARITCRKDRKYSEVKKIYQEIRNKKYDWPGVIYFGWRVALKKYFKIPIPKNNKWESEDRYFCTEAVGRLIDNKKYSMTAPVQLLEKLLIMELIDG